MDRVERYYQVGDLERAAEVLQGRVDESTQDEGVFHILADTWFLRGEGTDDPIAAKSCYRECLRVAASGLKSNRDSFVLRKDEALALAKLGQLDRAERKFLGLRPTEGQDLIALIDYNLACVYAQKRKKYLALEHLEAALYAKDYYRQLAWVDPDFDPLWPDAMFQALVFRT